MEQNKIICPNCGAENEYAGNCQYCGSPLKSVDTEIAVSEEVDGGPQYVEDTLGLFYQTFNKFDKLTQIQVCNIFYEASDISVIKKNYPEREEIYLRVNVEKLPCTLELLIDRNRKISITPHNKVKLEDGICDFKISQNTLFEMCQSIFIEARIVYEDTVGDIKIKDLKKYACLFYNRLCDNTQFVECYNDIKLKRIPWIRNQIDGEKLYYNQDSNYRFHFDFTRYCDDASDYVRFCIYHPDHIIVNCLFIDNIEIKAQSNDHNSAFIYFNVDILPLMCNADKIYLHLTGVKNSHIIKNITKSINYNAVFHYYLRIVESANHDSDFLAYFNKAKKGNYKCVSLTMYGDNNIDDLLEELKEAKDEKKEFVNNLKEEAEEILTEEIERKDEETKSYEHKEEDRTNYISKRIKRVISCFIRN